MCMQLDIEIEKKCEELRKLQIHSESHNADPEPQRFYDDKTVPEKLNIFHNIQNDLNMKDEVIKQSTQIVMGSEIILLSESVNSDLNNRILELAARKREERIQSQIEERKREQNIECKIAERKREQDIECKMEERKREQDIECKIVERKREQHIECLVEVIALLQGARRGLMSTVRAVSTNNGATWIEASECILESEKQMRAVLIHLTEQTLFPSLSPSLSPFTESISPDFRSSSLSSQPCSKLESSLGWKPQSTSNFKSNTVSVSDFNFLEEEVEVEVEVEAVKNAVDSVFVQSVPSIVQLLQHRSSEEICALSLCSPIYIPTDDFISPTCPNSFGDMNQNATESLHGTNTQRRDNRLILDVVGIKINAFKNSLSAIQLFLSARMIVKV